MLFSDFSKIFRDLRGISSTEIVIELANEITGINVDFFASITSDAIGRYCTGGTKFKKLAKKLKPYVNEENFKEYLLDNFSDNFNDLIKALKKYDINININNWDSDISKLFINIINNAIGLNDNVVSTKDELGMIQKITISSTEGTIEESSQIISKELNQSIKVMETIEKSKLDPELQEYYDVKITRPDNEIIHSLVPKNEEALKKFPINFQIGFDTSNHTPEEIEKMKDLKSIIKEVNLTNKPYSFGTPSFFQERLGKYPNPFSRINNTLGMVIYLFPDPNARIVNWSITLKNKHLELRFSNIIMHLLVNDGNEITLSNIRNNDEKFIFTITFTWNIKEDGNRYIHTNYQFHIKEKYYGDVEVNEILFKWQNIANDNSSKIEIYSNDTKKIVISSNNVGKIKYTSQAYNKLNSIIAHYERLKYIEEELHQKFSIEYPRFYDEFNAIDMVYYSLKEKNKEFRGNLTFNIELLEKEDSIKIGEILHNVKCGLGYVHILNNRIELTNTNVFFEDVIVANIEYNDNIQKIYFQANKAKLIINE